MDDALRPASVLARCVAVADRQWRFLAVIVALDAAPAIALEFAPPGWARIGAFLGLVTLYWQLLVTCRTLALLDALPADHDPRRPTEGRYPGAFLLSLLQTGGIALGLVALVLPGVALLTLWSLALPAFAAERLGAAAALARSWRLVRPRFGRIALLALTWLAPFLATTLLTAGIVLTPALEDSPIAWAAVNLCMSIWLVFGSLFWAVVYATVRDGEETSWPHRAGLASGSASPRSTASSR